MQFVSRRPATGKSLLLTLTLLGLSVLSSILHGATLTVSNTADTGPGSLRQTIATAVSDDVIVFESSMKGKTIELTSGELVVTQKLHIVGHGMLDLTLDAKDLSRIFRVEGTLILEGMTLKRGKAPTGGFGGAVYSTGHGFALKDCKVMECQADEGGAVYQAHPVHRLSRVFLYESWFTGNSAKKGGAINQKSGFLTIVGCTVDNNTAELEGGGAWLGGSGVTYDNLKVDMGNCTFSANTAPTSAAIHLVNTELNCVSSTIYDNRGAQSVNSSGFAYFRFINSVFAGTRQNAGGTLTTDVYVNAGTSAEFIMAFLGLYEGSAAISPQTNTDPPNYLPKNYIGSPFTILDPQLGPLSMRGKMPVHSPLQNSVLIGRGLFDSDLLSTYLTDQLGDNRPISTHDTLGAVISTGNSPAPNVFYSSLPRIYAVVAFDRSPGKTGPVHLWGGNFLLPGQCTTPPKVMINDQAVTSQHNNDGSITFQIPPSMPEDATILLDVCGQLSQKGFRRYLKQPLLDFDPPAILQVTPEVFNEGQTITVTARNVGPQSLLFLNGIPVASPTSGTSTFTFIAPPSDTRDARLAIVSGSRTSLEISKTYAPPVVNKPDWKFVSTAGGQMEITGTNFGFSPVVVVSGQPASRIQSTPTNIVFLLPAGQGSGHTLHVVSKAMQSQPVTFDYTPPGIIPASLNNQAKFTAGNPITIQGTNFGTSPIVELNNVNVQLLEFTHTSAVIVIPPGQGKNLPLRLKAGDQWSPVVNFSYDPPGFSSNPLGNQIIPTRGGRILVSGTNFGISPTLLLDSVPAFLHAVSHNLIEFELPPGAGAGHELQVVTGGQSSEIYKFSYFHPFISSVSPSSIPTEGGTVVTISGSNFSTSPTVTIGGRPAQVLPAEPNQDVHSLIRVRVPAGDGKNLGLLLTAGGLTSNTQLVSYLPPSVTLTQPSAGTTEGGTIIQVIGSNFGPTPVVLFDGIPIAPRSRSHSEITFLTPPGQGVGHEFEIDAGGQRTPKFPFSYLAPVIETISPAPPYPTLGGMIVTLEGANFGPSPEILLGGTPIPVIPDASGTLSHSRISFRMPAGAGVSIPILVVAGGQVSNVRLISYLAPVLSQAAPAAIPTQGGNVHLSGSNFGPSPTVRFDGATLVPTSRSHTGLDFTIPPGQGRDHTIEVESGGQRSGKLTVAYLPPAILSVDPTVAPTAGGTLLTLTGSNFGLTPSVTLNGNPVPFQNHAPELISHSMIRVFLPAGEGENLPIQVTAGGQESNPQLFSYLPPSLTQLIPNSGSTAGGTKVVIRGSNFGLNPTILLNGVPVPTTSPSTHSQLEFNTPFSSTAGIKNISVRVGSRTSGTLPFTYLKVPASLVIKASETTVSLGRTLRLTAELNYDDGTSTDVTQTATWTSSSSAVARVIKGVVTGLTTGPCTITVQSAGLSASAQLNVANVMEYQVTSEANEGRGSLRHALDSISPGGTIHFSPDLHGKEILVSSVMQVIVPVTIRGPGANLLRIRSASGTGIFSISIPKPVTIEGLAFSGGKPAIKTSKAQLTLQRCLFELNQADRGAALDCSFGSLTAEDCLFAGNTAVRGGAVYLAKSEASFTRCTFYSNAGSTRGGAIYSDLGIFSASQCTFSANTAGTASTLFSSGPLDLSRCTVTLGRSSSSSAAIVSQGETRLKNNIIARNFWRTTELNLGVEGTGTILSLGNNLIGSNQGAPPTLIAGLPSPDGDYVGTPGQPLNPLLAPLGNNGGLTPTHNLLPASPALDHGSNDDAPPTDQRGAPRIINGTTDIGSVEFTAE